jgi:hypothetical protein
MIKERPMFYYYFDYFDMLPLQTTKDDNHELEAAKTGQPNLLGKLLARVASALFPEAAVVDAEDEVIDSGQPASLRPKP